MINRFKKVAFLFLMVSSTFISLWPVTAGAQIFAYQAMALWGGSRSNYYH